MEFLESLGAFLVFLPVLYLVFIVLPRLTMKQQADLERRMYEEAQEAEKKRKAEQEKQDLKEGRKVACPSCGAANERSQTLCHACGMSLNKISCVFCGARNWLTNKNCFSCGKAMEETINAAKISCSKCGAFNAPSWENCYKCGQRLRTSVDESGQRLRTLFLDEPSEKKITCVFCNTPNRHDRTVCFLCGKPLEKQETVDSNEEAQTEVPVSAQNDLMVENFIQSSVVDEQIREACQNACTAMYFAYKYWRKDFISSVNSMLWADEENRKSAGWRAAAGVAGAVVGKLIFPGAISDISAVGGDYSLTREQREAVERHRQEWIQLFDAVCELINKIKEKMSTDDAYLCFCHDQMQAFGIGDVRLDKMFEKMAQRQNLPSDYVPQKLLAVSYQDEKVREEIRKKIKNCLHMNAKISCSSCGAINNATNAACFACGKTLETVKVNAQKENSDEKSKLPTERFLAYWQCSYCGAMNKANKTICGECGASTKAQEEAQ